MWSAMKATVPRSAENPASDKAPASSSQAANERSSEHATDEVSWVRRRQADVVEDVMYRERMTLRVCALGFGAFSRVRGALVIRDCQYQNRLIIGTCQSVPAA
jgi:hypothetical protein